MYSSIVLGTDGSDTAREAVRQAIELAKAVGARIHLVSAYQPVPESRLREERKDAPEEIQWAINPRQDVEKILRDEGERIEEAGVKVETHFREGDPASAVLDVVEEENGDLVIVGNKGMTGARRFLLGSVPDKIAHHAACSVLIIRTT
jgi:nucleotide-binding universal stress UspA family protein